MLYTLHIKTENFVCSWERFPHRRLAELEIPRFKRELREQGHKKILKIWIEKIDTTKPVKVVSDWRFTGILNP